MTKKIAELLPEGADRPDMPIDDRQSLARYKPSLKDISVAEVDRRRLENPRDRTIYREVARQFGVGEQSLRLWVKKHDTERMTGGNQLPAGGTVAEVLSPDQMKAELQNLRRQIQKLRTENEVLKRAFVVFSSEWGSARKEDPEPK